MFGKSSGEKLGLKRGGYGILFEFATEVAFSSPHMFVITWLRKDRIILANISISVFRITPRGIEWITFHLARSDDTSMALL